VFILSVIAMKLSSFKFRRPIEEMLPYG
jgi:hypothetical protein